jgi:hypothetical protein
MTIFNPKFLCGKPKQKKPTELKIRKRVKLMSKLVTAIHTIDVWTSQMAKLKGGKIHDDDMMYAYTTYRGFQGDMWERMGRAWGEKEEKEGMEGKKGCDECDC